MERTALVIGATGGIGGETAAGAAGARMEGARVAPPARGRGQGLVIVASRDQPRAASDTTAISGAPRLLLRVEAALALAGAIAAYHHLGGSWWVFAALLIAPDLSFFGYVAGPRMGARVYNAVHTYLAPAALALAGILLPSLLPLAAIWVSHIAADRVMGYGLKYPSAFGETHLTAPGKRRQHVASGGKGRPE
jgi:hypothetical protein